MADVERDWTRDPDVARAMQIFSSARDEARAMTIEANQGAERVLQLRLIKEKLHIIDESEPRFVRIKRNGEPPANTEIPGAEAAGL